MFPQSSLRRLAPLVPISVRRRLWYRRRFGVWPHLFRPRTYNEKVNWRIIYDRRPLLEGTCDKLTMKDRARAAVPGLARVPRTLWAGIDVSELAHVDLPEHWVLKPNHRTGLVYLGRGEPDIAELIDRTRGWADGQHWRATGEWAYRSARPLLLAEEFIGQPGDVPDDYKVFVFAGTPTMIEVHTGRFAEHRTRAYTPEWTPLRQAAGRRHEKPTDRPARLAEMLASAAALAEGFDMLRVDFYEQDGELWFGELTPYPGSGLVDYGEEIDALMGRAWRLPRLPGRVQQARKDAWARLAPRGAGGQVSFSGNVARLLPDAGSRAGTTEGAEGTTGPDVHGGLGRGGRPGENGAGRRAADARAGTVPPHASTSATST